MKAVKQIVLLLTIFVCSCNKTAAEDPSAAVKEQQEKEVSELLDAVRSSKPINTFDEMKPDTWYYTMGPSSGSPMAKLARRVITGNKVEGKGSFSFTYSFSGFARENEKETVFFQQKWGDFRPDLGFEPLGISMWIRGHRTNKGVFRFVLLHDDKMYYDNFKIRQTYEYTDTEILRKEEWTRLVIPYSWFKPYSGEEGVEFNPSRCMGFRIEIVNEDGGEASNCEFLIDNLEQLTSYEPVYSKNAKFSSLFIQLNKVYEDYDWEWAFKSCLEAGIDTWIIQYSIGFGEENHVSWYSNTSLDFIEKRYTIIDDMVKAAEKVGFKLIFGLFGGRYSDTNNQDQNHYDMLHSKNARVVDEVARNFGSSPCFAGWYITEEFHDGNWRGWHAEKSRDMLADYLEGVAKYAKSKVDKPVCIAPALWRGMPADLCGLWFEKIFERTPDIDVLYLQDCAGRGPATITSVQVDLPNYFSKIKEACDKTGVQFGVDIESFMSCDSPNIPYQAKDWNEELKYQLGMAGNFTEYITNFSWATFKPSMPNPVPGKPSYPGAGAFKDYKEYVESLGK